MAFVFESQDVEGAEDWTAIDADALTLFGLKLTQAYSHPTTVTFTLVQGNAPGSFDKPIPMRKGIRFWDTTDANGLIDAAHPIFLGHVETVTPAPNSSREIAYTLMDPTRRAAVEACVFNGVWQQPDPDVKPIPGTNTYPRLVGNVNIETDTDYTFSRFQNFKVGEIIQRIFDDQKLILHWILAAPADGSAPYVIGDLTAMNDFKPQDKLVFNSQTIRAVIDRMMAFDPKRRIIFIPSTRKWRVRDLTTAPAHTLVLNDWNPANGKVVLSLELHRSMETRATAIRIYGPEVASAPQLAYWWKPAATNDPTPVALTDTLVPIDVGQDYTDEFGATFKGHRQWQIVDPDKRRLLRLLPSDAFKPTCSPTLFILTRYPTLSVLWPTVPLHDNGSGGVNERGYFCEVGGIVIDVLNGIVTTADYLVQKRITSPPSGSPVTYWVEPEAVEFLFSCLDTPISVRKPDTEGTFEGTAYTDGGMEYEYPDYDDMLAVGWEFGVPVTTPERLAEFGKYAQAMLDARKDIIYTGVAVLDGVHTDYLGLNKRVNFTSVDENGDDLTTGLEAINAWITDVEIDYENKLTTLTLSSDYAEVLGLDPNILKARLKIVAMQQTQTSYYNVTLTPGGYKIEYGIGFTYKPRDNTEQPGGHT